MLTVFFDMRGIIMVDYVLPNQTVNQQFYIQDLTNYEKGFVKGDQICEISVGFAIRQCIGTQGDFGPPVFSHKTNTNVQTPCILTRSC